MTILNQNMAKKQDSFIIYIETSNYIEDRPLPIGKNKNVIGLMEDELGGKIMTEFAALRPKTYSYLTDDGNTDSGTHVIKKSKRKNMCIIKRIRSV